MTDDLALLRRLLDSDPPPAGPSLGVNIKARLALESRAGHTPPVPDPRHPGRHPRPRRRRIVLTAVAGLAAGVLAVVAVGTQMTTKSAPNEPSPSTPPASIPIDSQWQLISSVTSPFHAVGVDPHSAFLVCVTETTCYATSASSTAGSSAALYRSTDGGQSWTPTAPLPEGLTAPVACSTAQTCLVAVSAPLLPNESAPTALPIATTRDGGQHWTVGFLRAPAAVTGARIDMVACSSSQFCVLHMLGTSGSHPWGGFFHSSDAGSNWIPSSATSPLAPDGLYALRCASDGSCIGVTITGGLTGQVVAVKSRDSGETWTAGAPAPLVTSGGSIWADCGDTTHCLLAYSAGSVDAISISATSDAGLTWRTTTATPGWENLATSVSCSSGTDCSIATAETSSSGLSEPAIEATADAGKTWTAMGLTSVDHIQLGGVWTLTCPTSQTCTGVAQTADATQNLIITDAP